MAAQPPPLPPPPPVPPPSDDQWEDIDDDGYGEDEDDYSDMPALVPRNVDGEDDSDEEDEESECDSPHPRQKVRKSYTFKEKKRIVRLVDQYKLNQNSSQRKACEVYGVTESNYRSFRKQLASITDGGVIVRSSSRQVHPGRPGLLKEHSDVLLRFVFELREQGMGVTYRMIVNKASQLSRDFREKSQTAKLHIVVRWVKTNSLVYRMGTTQSQRPPSETVHEALDYLKYVGRVKCKESNRDPRFIMNMDQTPVFFTHHGKKTLAKKGSRCVNQRISTSDTKRATFAPTICADGTSLCPMLIFKGERDGRIVKREFPHFPPVCIYACQIKAWMDEDAMLKWVQEVLEPYVSTAPPNIVPLLILDSYRCHMMASVVQKIQDLGVEVEHLPGGCTGHLQPLDVGLNKPIKTRIRQQWEDWMLEEGMATGVVVTPSREQIVYWTITAFQDIPVDMVRKAWRNKEYSWFEE